MGADEEGMHERLQTHLRELRSLNREIAEMKPPTLGSFLTLCWRELDSNLRFRHGETPLGRAMWFSRTTPPAGRGTDPERDEKFESGFLQA